MAAEGPHPHGRQARGRGDAIDAERPLFIAQETHKNELPVGAGTRDG